MELPYIFQTQICFALLWVLYRALLQHGRQFDHNRAYLLGAVAVSFVVPLLSIPVYPAEQIVVPVFAGEIVLPAGLTVTEVAPQTVGMADVAWIVYGTGALLLFGALVVQSVRLWRRVRGGQRIVLPENGVVYYTDKVETAFSFFNRIFVNRTRIGDAGLPHVIAHEMAHVHLRHSLDSLLCEILTIALWWNPFVWLWSRSLKEVHEFQADRRVLRDEFDSSRYIYLIIRNLTDLHPEFVRGFSYSLLKNRLIMIEKQKRGKPERFRILLAAPTLVGLLALFSFTERPATDEPPQAQQKQVITIKKSIDGNGNAQAAYTIDGREVTLEELNTLKPELIERINVSTDALPNEVAAPGKPVNGLSGAVVMAGRNADSVQADGVHGGVMIKVQGNKTPVSLSENVVIYVNGEEVNREIMSKIDAEAIQSIDVIKEKLGGDTTGIIRIQLKDGKTLVSAIKAPATNGEIVGYYFSDKKTATDAQATVQTIRIRSRSSNTAMGSGEGKPLFIVDGVEAVNVDNIPTENIQRIEVLKDAASTAVYGQRGENGVIIVTTKSAAAAQSAKIFINGQPATMEEFAKFTPKQIKSMDYDKATNTMHVITK
ncbi:MAG: TonB-dependent receptor plug domain-containing protein [Rikenellaceae bacterium]|jgi:TonB-dependent SusC/RagA subfamily outer membrane receptor|nr:TonB-dependent receptor plug domain-containing protein [Rikenellaceae bacterium]